MTTKLGTAGLAAVLLAPGTAQAAPLDFLNPVSDSAQNIWTRVTFGPIQIAWFAVAIVLGMVAFFLYYRGLLRTELRREPDPLEPAKHRYSAFAMAIIVTALTLGWIGVGYAWIIGMLLVAAVVDFAGGRRWLLWVAIALALGLAALGFFGS
jgi:hypothetical protein